MRAIRISQISIGAVVLFASPIISAQSDKAKGAREDDLSMPLNPHARGPVNSISIHQEIDFNASPEQLYEALLDPNQFTAFSGRPAEIDRKIGGAFSLFGGHIIGRNVELIPNERIVQAWRVVTWPEGVYSIARFEIKPQGTGARVLLDHVGFPEGLHDHLAEGWESNYWSLLKKYFH
jgi:activator of HSP90 ATPase